MSNQTDSNQQEADRWLQENREAVESPSLGCTQQALLVQQAKQAVLLDEIRALEGTLDDSNKSASACLAKLKALESQIGVNQEALTYLEQVTSLETVFISAGQQVMEKALQMSTVTDGVVLEAKKELSAEVGGAWSWVSQLADLNRLHTRNAADYQAFHHSAYELNALLNSRASSSSAAIAAIPANGMLGSIKRMNTVLTDNFAQFNRLWQLAGDLTQRSRAVVPLQQRFNADATPFAGKNVFKFDDGETVLEAGEEVTVIDNSQSYSWKVRRSDGSEVEVPSTCIWLAPADPQAVQLAIGLRQKLLSTWSQVLRNLRQWSANFFDSYLTNLLKNPTTISSKIKGRVTDFLDSLRQASRTYLGVDNQLSDRLVKSVDKLKDRLTITEGPLGSLVESELVLLQACLTKLLEHLNEWQICSQEALEAQELSRAAVSEESSAVLSRIELLTQLQQESESKFEELQVSIKNWRLTDVRSKFAINQQRAQLPLLYDRSSLATMDRVTGLQRAELYNAKASEPRVQTSASESRAPVSYSVSSNSSQKTKPAATVIEGGCHASTKEDQIDIDKNIVEVVKSSRNPVRDTGVSTQDFHTSVLSYVEERKSEFSALFASWADFDAQVRSYVLQRREQFTALLGIQTKETASKTKSATTILSGTDKVNIVSSGCYREAAEPANSEQDLRLLALNYIKEHQPEFSAIFFSRSDFKEHIRRHLLEHREEYKFLLEDKQTKKLAVELQRPILRISQTECFRENSTKESGMQIRPESPKPAATEAYKESVEKLTEIKNSGSTQELQVATTGIQHTMQAPVIFSHGAFKEIAAANSSVFTKPKVHFAATGCFKAVEVDENEVMIKEKEKVYASTSCHKKLFVNSGSLSFKPEVAASGSFRESSYQQSGASFIQKIDVSATGCFRETFHAQSAARFVQKIEVAASGSFRESSYQQSGASFTQKIDVSATGCFKEWSYYLGKANFKQNIELSSTESYRELNYVTSALAKFSELSVADSSCFKENSLSLSAVHFTNSKSFVASGCFKEQMPVTGLASTCSSKEIELTQSSASFPLNSLTAQSDFRRQDAAFEIDKASSSLLSTRASKPVVNSGCEFVETSPGAHVDAIQIFEDRRSPAFSVRVSESRGTGKEIRSSEAQTDLNYKSVLWNMFALLNGHIDINLSFIVSYFGVEAFAREYMLLREFRSVATQAGEGGEVEFLAKSIGGADVTPSRSFQLHSSGRVSNQSSSHVHAQVSRLTESGVVRISESDGEMLDLSDSTARISSAQGLSVGSTGFVKTTLGNEYAASGWRTESASVRPHGGMSSHITGSGSGNVGAASGGIIDLSDSPSSIGRVSTGQHHTTVSSGSRGHALFGEGVNSLHQSVYAVGGTQRVSASMLDASTRGGGGSSGGVTQYSTTEGRVLNLSESVGHSNNLLG